MKGTAAGRFARKNKYSAMSLNKCGFSRGELLKSEVQSQWVAKETKL